MSKFLARPTRVRTKTWFSGDLLQILHIGAVDLDGIDMQHLQVAERGIAGAEIVDRHPHAQFAQLRDELGIFLEMMQRGGFGQLHDQPAATLRFSRGHSRRKPCSQAGSDAAVPETLTARVTFGMAP